MDSNLQACKKLFAAADLFQICGIAFDFPTEHLAKGIEDGSIRDDINNCLQELGSNDDERNRATKKLTALINASESESLHSRMKTEHSRLFANTSRPTIWIYETMFCFKDDGRNEKPSLFISPTCLHVEESMRKAGVELSANNRQPADYLPTELQFLSYLCAETAREISKQNESSEALNRLLAFMTQHLDRWLLEFFEEVCNHTALNDYKALCNAASLGYIQLSKHLHACS